MVARITHPNSEVRKVLILILSHVMARYPQQCLWYLVGGLKSTQRSRSKLCANVINDAAASLHPLCHLLGLNKRQTKSSDAHQLITEANSLVDQLLGLGNYELAAKETLAMSANFPGLLRLMPSRLIVPIQASLTLALPASASDMATHVPFPPNLPTFKRALSPLALPAPD
jgi:serine/threonine-protein kinase ATR